VDEILEHLRELRKPLEILIKNKKNLEKILMRIIEQIQIDTPIDMMQGFHALDQIIPKTYSVSFTINQEEYDALICFVETWQKAAKDKEKVLS